MFLKRIQVSNYRQLDKIVLDFQNDLTVLAGPNNSGKTTLISVLKGIFDDSKLKFSYSDIPTYLSVKWIPRISSIFRPVILENSKEIGIEEIVRSISNDGHFLDDYVIDRFEAKIQVDYDPQNDDIQNFADYLMDLDESMHSFYFVYTYEPSITVFEKLLNENYDKIKSRLVDIEKPDCKEKDTKIYFIREELLKLYSRCLTEKCYFCNSQYQNLNSMEVSELKNL